MRMIVILFIFALNHTVSADTAFVQAYQEQFSEEYPYRVHDVPHGDFNLHAREFLGSKENGDEIAIVMMHGFPDNLHIYDRVIPSLSHSARVIVFDFLGWGESDKPQGFEYSVEDQQQQLTHVVEYFDLQKVVLVMHDMAGPPSINWALVNEAKVLGLVLLNTYYGPMRALRAPEAINFYASSIPDRETIVDIMQTYDFLWESGLRDQLSRFFVQDEPRATFTKLFVTQSLSIRPAFFNLSEHLFAEVAARGVKQAIELPAFSKPVAIIFGGQDPYLNPSIANRFHELFTNSRLHLVKDAGHFVQLDQPNETADLIKSFIDELN
ncbi:MAG: alpha/beta fold hydrolase [Thiohalomonadales bacterium]